MANPKSDGRMIRKNISESDGFNALTLEAAVLFCMMIPHMNPFGKMNGGPGYIKDIVCPKKDELTLEKLPLLLQEINTKTNVKWFHYDKRYWIHSINFLTEHQKIEVQKLGKDQLPNYQKTSRELVGDYSTTSREQVVVQCEPESESECEREREWARSDFEPVEPETCHPSSPISLLEGEVDHASSASCLSEHAWEKFKALMPTRNGKFLDEDAVREKWRRHPAIHNQVLAALINYKASSEVQDGAVMSPMKFISGRFKDWLQPEEQPLGGGPGPPPTQNRKIDADNLKQEQAEYAARMAAAGTAPLRERIDIACLNQS